MMEIILFLLTEKTQRNCGLHQKPWEQEAGKGRRRWKRMHKIKGMCLGGRGSLSSLAVKADKKQNPDLVKTVKRYQCLVTEFGVYSVCLSLSLLLLLKADCILGILLCSPVPRGLLETDAFWKLSPDTTLLRALLLPCQRKVKKGAKWNIATCTFREKKPKYVQSSKIRLGELQGREKLNISSKVLKGTAWLCHQSSLYLLCSRCEILFNAIAFVMGSSKKLFSTTKAPVRCLQLQLLQLLLML